MYSAIHEKYMMQCLTVFLNSVATTRATLVCKHPYIPHVHVLSHLVERHIFYIRLQSLRPVACLDFKIKSNNTINGCGL